MDKSQKPKNLKNIRRENVLENLKDIGSSTAKIFKEDLLNKTSEEFLKELFGTAIPQKYSGEISPGEALELGEVFSGKQEENQKLKQQLTIERNLAQEEKILNEKKSNELRIQLQALMQEIYALSQTTQNLGEEVRLASFEAPANPGVYHLIFFEKILEFIQSFRKKIEDASLWLASSNKRAEKKNFWAMYKKKGSSFLLSPDHYLQRSAG